jgi:flagellar biosynthesis chaperone FliJ
MNWKNYQNFVNQKVKDSKYNLDQAEKKVKQARANYESALREKENFEIALDDLMDGIEK